MQDHVTATIAGKKRTFRIPRLPPEDTRSPLERQRDDAYQRLREMQGTAGPRQRLRHPIAAVAALKRLAGDGWTSADVIQVLEAGFEPAPDDPPDFVRQIVQANGPAAYISLAVKILGAHLNGLSADEARFDEAEALAA